MKAVLAIDSYKGCLTSSEAEQAALSAFSSEDTVTMVPVSDGGEGFSSILTGILGGTMKEVDAHDPLGNPIKAQYGLIRDSQVAVIETAAATGLSLVPPSRRNPSARVEPNT